MFRRVQRGEYELVNRLCADAYLTAGIIGPGDSYLEFLADTAGRAEDPTAEVFVLVDGDGIVGTVTMCPYGSALTEVCLPAEMEPRVIAVSPARTREGLAGQLVAGAESWARTHGFHTVTVCVTDYNTIGHNLYRKLGFIRQPHRDWQPAGGVRLETYTKSVDSDHAATYCGRCGGDLTNGEHAECQLALDLEPPRYCTFCKRRMIVQVTPTGWSARCKEHGERTASNP